MAEIGFYDEPSDGASVVPSDVKIKRLEAALTAAQKELVDVTAAGKKHATRCKDLESDVDVLRRNSATASAGLQDAERRLGTLQEELHEAEAAVRSARQERDAAVRDCEARGRRVLELEAALDSSVSASTAEAAARATAEHMAEGELEAVTAALEALRERSRAELAARDAEIEELRAEVRELAGGAAVQSSHEGSGIEDGNAEALPDAVALGARCRALEERNAALEAALARGGRGGGGSTDGTPAGGSRDAEAAAWARGALRELQAEYASFKQITGEALDAKGGEVGRLTKQLIEARTELQAAKVAARHSAAAAAQATSLWNFPMLLARSSGVREMSTRWLEEQPGLVEKYDTALAGGSTLLIVGLIGGAVILSVLLFIFAPRYFA